MSGQDALQTWMREFQGLQAKTPIADPSRSAGMSDLVQNHLADMPFDSEHAGYVRLLHALAPKDLKDE